MEERHIVKSYKIDVEIIEYADDNMIKYNAYIRQHDGCRLSNFIVVEKDNYNEEDVIRYLGYYLIYNKLRIKNERLQTKVYAYNQVLETLDKRYKITKPTMSKSVIDIREEVKIKRMIEEINSYIEYNNNLMKLFYYGKIQYSIVKNFSKEHIKRFYRKKIIM